MTYTDVDLNGKTVLITGGAGFIGANVAFHIQEHYPQCRVVVFDAFLMGHFKNLRGFKGECVSGDIGEKADMERLFKEYTFDYVFHQAAISDTTVMDQKLMVKINTNAFVDLLNLSLAHGVKGVVYASSAGTYGNSPAPNTVGAGEEPENVYGFSKLMMDHAAYQFMKAHPEMSIVGLRYFNVYGPREVYKGKTASMILQLGLQMLSGKTPKLFKWGEQKRDFVFIEDVVQANLRGISPKKSGVYNVGAGAARMYNEIIGCLHKELGLETEVEYIDNPWSFFQMHTEAAIEASKEGLGYEPNYPLEKGVAAYASEIRRIYEEEIKG